MLYKKRFIISNQNFAVQMNLKKDTTIAPSQFNLNQLKFILAKQNHGPDVNLLNLIFSLKKWHFVKMMKKRKMR